MRETVISLDQNEVASIYRFGVSILPRNALPSQTQKGENMRTEYKNLNGESGIEAYEIHEDNNAIDIEYANGGVYTYYRANLGDIHFNVICELAVAGAGLNAYLNRLRNRRDNRLAMNASPSEVNLVNVNVDAVQAAAIIANLMNEHNIAITLKRQ